MLRRSCRENEIDKRNLMRSVREDWPKQSKRQCFNNVTKSKKDTFETNPFPVLSPHNEGFSIDIDFCDLSIDKNCDELDNIEKSSTTVSNIALLPSRPISPCSHDDRDSFETLVLADDEPLHFNETGGDDDVLMDNADDIIQLIDALVSADPPLISLEVALSPSPSCEVQRAQNDDSDVVETVLCEFLDPFDVNDISVDNSVDDDFVKLISILIE